MIRNPLCTFLSFGIKWRLTNFWILHRSADRSQLKRKLDLDPDFEYPQWLKFEAVDMAYCICGKLCTVILSKCHTLEKRRVLDTWLNGGGAGFNFKSAMIQELIKALEGSAEINEAKYQEVIFIWLNIKQFTVIRRSFTFVLLSLKFYGWRLTLGVCKQ